MKLAIKVIMTVMVVLAFSLGVSTLSIGLLGPFWGSVLAAPSAFIVMFITVLIISSRDNK